MGPGLTTLTRTWRSFRSVVQVRAKERRAAFVALYTLRAANPLDPTIEEDRMTEAPSASRGSAAEP